MAQVEQLQLSLAGHAARPTPFRRGSRERCICRSGEIPINPARSWRPAALRRSSRREPILGCRPMRRKPYAASAWHRGSRARKTRYSRVSWLTGSGRLILGLAWSRPPAIWASTADLPSHPELLDWLASEIVAHGWSLKAMHRLIVTSAVYRQSSRLDVEGIKCDAGNRLLWRKAPTRLEAEMVRDAMLAVSGILDDKLGGPSLRDQEIVKVPGTPAMLYVAVDPRTRGPGSADPFPRVGSRRSQPVARCIRLPRSIDDSAPPPRDHHAAPGAFVDEQCTGTLSVRCTWPRG